MPIAAGTANVRKCVASGPVVKSWLCFIYDLSLKTIIERHLYLAYLDMDVAPNPGATTSIGQLQKDDIDHHLTRHSIIKSRHLVQRQHHAPGQLYLPE